MIEAFQKKNLLLLIFSILGLYSLAPSLDVGKGVLVSLAFALIVILSSKPRFDKAHIKRYSLYIFIDILTYSMLYSDQPWDFLFHGGLWDSSPVPLIGCSIIMSLAGWLLLSKTRDRLYYLLITLGLQIPISLFVGTDYLQSILNDLAHTLGFVEFYSGAWQVWQFEWMLTYYLPIYFLSHKTPVRPFQKS